MICSERNHTKITLLAWLLSALLLSGCAVPSDYGLLALMLVEAPDRLIYISGEDQALVSDGSRIIEYDYYDGGSYYKISLREYDSNVFDSKYFHTDIVMKEGVYLISIAKKQWFSWKYYFQYTVQVVSPGEYNVSAAIPEDNFTFEKLEPTYCENVTAVMISPPSNIIYPVGYTGEVDLSGIVVKVAQGWFPKEYDIADLDYTLESDVDFSMPGSYIVKVYFTDDKGAERWFCFTVAVAEKAEK